MYRWLVFAVITCSILSPPVNGYLSDNGNYYRQSVTYSCRPGYHMLSESKTRTCLVFGQWSGVQLFFV